MVRYDKVNRRVDALAGRLEKLTREHKLLREEHQKVRSALDSTLHEVRRFSNEIYSYSESLSRAIINEGGSDNIKELSDTIFYTSGMMSSRLAVTDLELNPAAIEMQMKQRVGIYKKFEKAMHVLSLKARKQRQRIKLLGNSRLEIMALPSFELVPFVILDNAIKYSPEEQDISIEFQEKENPYSVIVDVNSVGPVVESNEEEEIFDRGARGRHVSVEHFPGEGLGLHLARILCDYHGIRISARSDQHSVFEIGGVPYSTFTVSLHVFA